MLREIANKYWFKWLIIGVILRLVLMPITLHPDLWGHSFVAYFFAYRGIFNPYEYLVNLGQDHPLVTNFGVADIFIYPPLTYFTLGIFRVLVMPFTDPNFIPTLWNGLGSAYSNNNLFSHLLFFKLPYLFVDVATGFLLASLFDKQNSKTKIFTLWMINPVTLYATFMMGQLDILPVFFVILSLCFVKQKKPYASLISLGVGGAYKMFPLLLIIPAALILKRELRQRIKLILAGIAPFVLLSLPYLGSSAFRTMVLFTPKSQKMLFMQFPVTAAEGIYPFVFILFLIYFWIYYRKISRDNLPFVYLSILLLLFSVTHYHPQWFLWVTPLLIWQNVKTNHKYWLLTTTLFAIWLLITLMFEPSLSVGLFGPVCESCRTAIGLSDILANFQDINMFKSLLRSIFAAASFMLIYLSVINEKS